MKKIIRTLVAASVLICGMVFTGCDMFLNFKLKNTEGKWFKYEGEVPDIPLGLTDDSKDDPDTGKLKNAEIYFYFDRNEGLIVAVQASSTEEIELKDGLFQTKIEIITGNVKTYEDFTTTRWISLTEVAPMTACEAPKVYTNPKECFLIGGENASDIKIQWKKVLANIIINKLLGE